MDAGKVWSARVGSRELGRFLQQGRFRDVVLRDSLRDAALGKSDVMIWRNDPSAQAELPALIVMDDVKQREFFAWSLTYFREATPLTAFTHVVSPEDMAALIERPEVANLGALENACVGLVLGETEALRTPGRESTDVALVACKSTYSFLMGRMLAFRSSERVCEEAARRFWRARSLTGYGYGVEAKEVQLGWSVINRLAMGSVGYSYTDPASPVGRIARVCSRIQCTEEGYDTDTWSEVAALSGFATTPAYGSHGVPRERRVAEVESILEKIAPTSARETDYGVGPFIGGFLLSSIAPGTLDHVGLVTSRISRAVLVWYGLLAGLRTRSSVKLAFGGLGRRIARDMLRSCSVLDSPTCDIGCGELDVASSGTGASLRFRTAAASRLEVEVWPGIDTVVPWPPKGRSDGRRASRQSSAKRPRKPPKKDSLFEQ